MGGVSRGRGLEPSKLIGMVSVKFFALVFCELFLQSSLKNANILQFVQKKFAL